jgi:hypothetical protein
MDTNSTLLTPRQSLFVDLIPSTAWFSNLRSELTSLEWKAVQQKTFHLAQMRCECCGGRGRKHPVECHERFSYDITTSTQQLIRTIALCPSCHKATHFGMAQILGMSNMAIGQLQKVNKWNREQTDFHIAHAFNEWRLRSTMSWSLDARWLLDFIPISNKTSFKINDLYTGKIQRPPHPQSIAGM